MWGCVACNFCVTVCPNDAFFKVPTGELELQGRQQYLLFSELCNDCGNCMTFCPEDGDPAVIKPRLYLDQARFDAAAGPRFLVSDDGRSVTSAEASEADSFNLVSLLSAKEGYPIADARA
jgi:putative selenate reductase